MKIFHNNHSEKFHQKLKENEEKLLLREFKIPSVIHNHYEANYMMGNKKALFKNVVQYHEFRGKYPFEFIPLTFHIEKLNSKVWKTFEQRLINSKNKEYWIIKPG